MSKTSRAGCVTCKARNIRCDMTRGPNGCRRCTQSGIICEGYLGTVSKIFRQKHGSRGNQPQTDTTRRTGRIHSSEITSSIDHPVLDHILRAGASPASSTSDPEHSSNHLGLSSGDTVPREHTGLHACAIVPREKTPTPPSEQIYAPLSTPTLSIQQNVDLITVVSPAVGDARIGTNCHVRPSGSMTQGQASLLDSIFSLADNPQDLPYTPGSPRSNLTGGLGTGQGKYSGGHLEIESLVNLQAETGDDIDADGYKNIMAGMLTELALDREVESNVVPFVVHSFTSWMSRFLFEPTRVLSLARDTIVRGHFEIKTLQRMILLANVVLTVSKSTDYELTHFESLDQQLVTNVVEIRTRSGLTRETALVAMESCHEFISITSKVGSLAGVLKIMELYAPVFRRACPEPGDKLVNLPEKLASTGLIDLNLKYYATFDVLQSVITHRPMFFRYDLKFLSSQDEALLDAENGPGLRWLIGVPDRLVFVLGKMNTLLEDHGNRLNPELVRELEDDIEACKPVAVAGPEEAPDLLLGRLMVQESWRLAGYVYLYMGLCGADTSDARVVKVQKMYMRLLGGIKARRNPDSFLLFPMIILGVATSSLSDQSILLARLWGIAECNKDGTMGNDLVRILNDIWARSAGRPTVWSDLRVACLRVIGM